MQIRERAVERLSIGRREFLAGMIAGVARRPLWASQAPEMVARWAAHFDQIGTRGVIAIRKPDGTIAVSDPVRAAIGYLPASTFKIPNTLIASDLGVVSGADEKFVWDGEVHSLNGKPFDAWNRDLTLRDAFSVSAIWVYQEIARRIGKERMAARLSALRYGNADIESAPIDQFWLHGKLRISALEQIDFLDRLWRGDVPASRKAIDTTRQIMWMEKGSKGSLYGKTGWTTDQNIGWFVGVIETQNAFHPFALNLDMPTIDLAPHRVAIVKAVASELGMW